MPWLGGSPIAGAGSGRRGGLGALAVVLAVVIVTVFQPARALERPTGPVVLEIQGRISETNDGEGRARFDQAMLSGLGVHEIRTRTPWTDGTVRFEGVLVRDVLAAAGAEGTMVRAVAINDYAVDIPIEDFISYPVILAFRRDGEAMGVRDKGPLWVIYPWSDHDELRTEVYHSRSIWQLKRMTVR